MKQPFHVHTGLVAPLDRQNVDTDQIVPKQFLKRIERTGFGQFLFYDWARLPDGTPDPEFVLNDPRYRGASILATGRNFGCGSSREHAPWALADFGFRAIVAPSFADIFATNCFKNGLLTVQVSEDQVAEILDRARRLPGYVLTVDLEQCHVFDSLGLASSFEMGPFRRECLLNGLDEIASALKHDVDISKYETNHAARFPVAAHRV
jgi:3-isopropylmalate/(R)-2-methylmalate dehydratase small subunit